jgi:hypothetical protein
LRRFLARIVARAGLGPGLAVRHALLDPMTIRRLHGADFIEFGLVEFTYNGRFSLFPPHSWQGR